MESVNTVDNGQRSPFKTKPSAVVNGEILATVPDLICLVDTETYTPVTTEALEIGKRVLIVGLQCYPMWRTPAGLELVGPPLLLVSTPTTSLWNSVKEAGKCISWVLTWRHQYGRRPD